MPLIWVLTGSKTGDNAQVLRAAGHMGLPFETKRLAVKAEFEVAKPKVEASLAIFDLEASDALTAPWPDLVITIGRRLSSAALWIKAQSGGRSKLALFNAPKGQADAFDLIVAPFHYRMDEDARVCRIGLPLIAADPARVAAARDTFADTLGAMASPLHVLLLGGDMGRRKLDPAFAGEIMRRMRATHARDGSIFASTSRRTPAAAADAIGSLLGPGDRLYRWAPGADDNPYYGLLAHGDTFTVTSDSLSMLTEVARLGRPLYIASPPDRGVLAKLAKGLGFGPARDLEEAAAYLVANGHAARLGDTLPATLCPPPDDTHHVAERLRQLVLRSN